MTKQTSNPPLSPITLVEALQHARQLLAPEDAEDVVRGWLLEKAIEQLKQMAALLKEEFTR